MPKIKTTFSGNPLDRADLLRGEDDILTDRLNSKSAKVMLLWDNCILSDEATGNICWVSGNTLNDATVKRVILLGMFDDILYYAADLNREIATGGKFRDLRVIAYKLNAPMGDQGSLGMAAQAKSMLNWHDSHQHCAACGGETHMIKAGYERVCPSCDTHHFPRTDPVVIMLGVRGDKAMIGRGPQLPKGMFTALAGFMEPGESIEEAVRRELMEETGVIVGDVQYITSQPWPYPSSLMIGCHAEIISGEGIPDGVEVEDVRWVTREEARTALKEHREDMFRLSPQYAIAHQLIQAWINDHQTS